MLTKNDIRQMAESAIYARGMEIYQAGKILNFHVQEEEKGTFGMEATVKGSSWNVYKVELSYNNVSGELTERDRKSVV